MIRMLLLATAISLIVPMANADAGSRHKHHSYRHHHHRAWQGPAYAPGAYYGRWQAPVGLQARTPGPPWAMPNECYTDEGYGRYSPCDRRR
jgi:hypothetical protein